MGYRERADLQVAGSETAFTFLIFPIADFALRHDKILSDWVNRNNCKKLSIVDLYRPRACDHTNFAPEVDVNVITTAVTIEEFERRTFECRAKRLSWCRKKD